ncbi:MAG: polymer-forming cytoskeletal protein [Nitrospirae bacterium]|nr:MAG: polymer-forming cytoskeletal protein [Nitrospirota bacterium]
MFHKNTEKLESLVGSNSSFKGNIDSKGTVRIDGSIDGNIHADWVVIGEKAAVLGDIVSRGIIVGGRVDGNLHAKEIVEIRNKGQVHGEVHTSKLTIIEGAIFEGRSSMQKEESKVVELLSKEKIK